MAALVTTYGGRPIVAPALREVPLESNPQALAFADALIRGEFAIVILLTGVGTRALLEVVQGAGKRDAFVAALATTRTVARGPKPLAVLRELGVPAWVAAPEPNTWRELVAALDARSAEVPLQGLRVAVQEYGVSNPDLLEALRERGADAVRVPVYRWALPEDLEPLRNGIRALANREIDVAMFTSATQVANLMQVAGSMQLQDAVLGGLGRAGVASIGPTTSEELRRQGVAVDMEPSHPKMGLLVREAAERAAGILERKRG